MRDVHKLLIGFLLVLLVLIGFSYTKESFQTTEKEQISDRFNVFSDVVKPLQNPFAPVGIRPEEAKKLRRLHETALNIPTIHEGFTNKIQIPITTSEDMFGLAKMCKEKAASMDNPFTDPEFAAQCGVCMTEGTYYDNQTFDAKRDGRGAGLLAYDKRKQEAIEEAEQKGYLFPHATPFPINNTNTCRGSSTDENASPVFAITGDFYESLKKREACIHMKKLGVKGSQGCAVCQKSKQYTWLDPVQTTNKSTLLLYGRGIATVKVGGRVKGQGISLQTNPTEVVLGAVTEGETLEVYVENSNPTDSEAPFVYIALRGENALEKSSYFDAFPFFSSDLGNVADNNKSILRLGRKQLPGLPNELSITGVKGSKNPTTNQPNKIMLDGIFPFTFIDKANTIGAYDCPASPLMTLEESAEKLLDDPCLRNPKGQGPGTYSDECLRSLVTENTNCTSLGSLTKASRFRFQGREETLRSLAGNKSKQDFITFVKKEIEEKANQSPERALLCTGKDISTPCDTLLENPNMMPNEISQQCLVYLYRNGAKKDESRIGSVYSILRSAFSSADAKGDVQFCQSTGSMNPETPTGLARFRSKIQEIGVTKGLRGIDAVKETLKTVFTRATGDLPIDREDNDGGRKTSYDLCFGKAYGQPAPNTDSRDARGNIPATQTSGLSCQSGLLSESFVIERTKSLLIDRKPIWMTKNFELTFLLKPTGIQPDWSNILRFGRTINPNTVDIPEECCMLGVRAIGVWFWPGNTRLHIRVGHERSGNWGIHDTADLQINTTYQIYIRADGSNVTIRVTDINKTTPLFNDTFNTSSFGTRYEGWVSVWGGDGWFTPAKGVVSDLCLKNL